MLEHLKELCSLDAVSGDEGALAAYLLQHLNGHCDYKVDPLGNILCYKQGKKRSAVRLMLDAHMDEVGLIVTAVTDSGFLKFQTVGGIAVSALLFRPVRIAGKINGVIGGKPIHLLSGEEAKKMPSVDSLVIDIGARNREEALALVQIGDRAVLCGAFTEMGELIRSKALDDRIGCAVLLSLLTGESEYDFYASFSVQEEIGLRGAKTAAYTIRPEAALVLEATTAADLAGVAAESRVCELGKGPAISFMDKATVYDKAFYQAALSSGIPCQPKAAVAGGNNSGSIHLSRGGVRTLAVSAPCRYIHSSSCTADLRDCRNMLALADYMKNAICEGRFL